MKNTKLALSALILAGILFLASSCSDDNSVKSKMSPQNFINELTGTTETYSAVFMINSTYFAPPNHSEPIEYCDVMAYLMENDDFVAPEFAKCNGVNMFDMVSDDDSKGQYQYSSPKYEPEFNVEIGGYLGGTLTFNASINMMRFTNIGINDTLNQNDVEVSYTGADSNMELLVEVKSRLGNLTKQIKSPAATGTITFTAEELSQIGGETTIALLQDRDETFGYQDKPILKRFSAVSSVICYVKN